MGFIYSLEEFKKCFSFVYIYIYIYIQSALSCSVYHFYRVYHQFLKFFFSETGLTVPNALAQCVTAKNSPNIEAQGLMPICMNEVETKDPKLEHLTSLSRYL